ncbi:hypothetical protein [Sinomicrobium soli]|uniref:hypothetical protein n=1 Tax=Sinomicrobium sp. N-1-3-6 TaxID=2219864 RepID=UPI000DCC4972|nr:hypothetical protein [Sinomicrobium sp. N-1-3-6]RAV29093.1 hypothetical protein DN748_09205 [Sinomicrobium sp. N-1-3-6]
MNPKAQSIVSYLGIFWLVAYFAGKDQRDDLSRYHLKQGLGLFITGILFNIAVTIVNAISSSLGMIVGLVGIVFLVFLIMGIINAVNEEKKPLPVIGKMFEDKFSFIDK